MSKQINSENFIQIKKGNQPVRCSDKHNYRPIDKQMELKLCKNTENRETKADTEDVFKQHSFFDLYARKS